MTDLLLDLLDKLIWTPDRLGRYGESLTARELKILDLFGKKGRILRNLFLPKDDGGTSEIDLVFITQKGIFVIESKNYSGWIFGRESDQYWTQSMPDRSKHRFYNPIKQNKTHIKWLRQYLGQDVPLFSFIVFSERCQLKSITLNTQDVHVLKRNMLRSALKSHWKRTPDVLSVEEVEQICEKLTPLTQADETIRQEHIDTIRSKFHKSAPAAPPEPAREPEKQICPKCGAALVLRTAGRSERAGKQFYGCSAFPKCRYIRNIESPDRGDE
ncbi:MAG: NERD domain-containing protein [Oscillospiraceae bacterium]|nr:NERD domain-containing protein [Oscillospiraceae bacterium]